jgi:hypothetical protein
MKNEEFKKLIENWNIPKMRQEVNPSNMRWILRNAAILHQNEPNFEKVITFAKKHM